MEDPRKTAKDLIRQATDDRLDNENLRHAYAMKAVRLIAKHGLLDEPRSRKPIATVADVVDRATDPRFVADVATRAETLVNGVERVAGSVGRFADTFGRRDVRRDVEPPRRRRRRYA